MKNLNLRVICLSVMATFLLSCEPSNREGRIEDPLNPQAATTPTLNNDEVSALQLLCKQLERMNPTMREIHEYSYKKVTCEDFQEIYSLQQRVSIGDQLPQYTVDINRDYYIKDIRFDKISPMNEYCKRANGTSVGRFYKLDSGAEYTIEIVSKKVNSYKDCFNDSMLSARTPNDLVCLRLWKNIKDNADEIQSELSYDTMTFVVGTTTAKLVGSLVHASSVDKISCTDAKKTIKKEAIRKK